MLYGEDRRCNTGDIRREVDRFKNDLNDMQGILNVVSELVQCTINKNVPNDTINFMRTLFGKILSLLLTFSVIFKPTN